jgi:uncharacterized protein CbrC (UPF0167 family)
MTIKGNVVTCDECGRQIGVPMEAKTGGQRPLDQRVCDWAVGDAGGAHTYQGDLCPDHLLEALLSWLRNL